jgi:hypothetical protein
VLMIVVAVTAGIGAVGFQHVDRVAMMRQHPADGGPRQAPRSRAPLPGDAGRSAAPGGGGGACPPDDTREIHLHLHGVSAGDVAAILERREDRQ